MTASYPKEPLPNGYPTTGAYTNGHTVPSMDVRQGEYSLSTGLDSPDHHVNKEQTSEAAAPSHPDHAPQAQYTPQQDVKFNPSAAATPTNSEYSLNPSSARSDTFPQYINRGGYQDASQQQRYQPTSAPNGGTPNHMAQTTSPSMHLVDGQPSDNHDSTRNTSSNNEVPVDPSIAASSPTYPPTHHYSPYPPQHEMQQYHTPPMYPRPEYGAPYSAPPHGLPGGYGHVTTSVSSPPSMASAGARPPGVSLAYEPRPADIDC